MEVTKDGQIWRIGTAHNVDWIASQTAHGLAVTTATPPVVTPYSRLASAGYQSDSYKP
jgi:hypothetical protein